MLAANFALQPIKLFFPVLELLGVATAIRVQLLTHTSSFKDFRDRYDQF